MKNKKAMLSQPMAGKSEEEIAAAREAAVAALEGKGYEVVNTLFTEAWYAKEAVEQVPLAYLAKSLESMSKCQAVYFCRGWEQARGCRIEHAAAVAYGLEVLYEVEPEEEPETLTKAEVRKWMKLTHDQIMKAAYHHAKDAMFEEDMQKRAQKYDTATNVAKSSMGIALMAEYLGVRDGYEDEDLTDEEEKELQQRSDELERKMKDKAAAKLRDKLPENFEEMITQLGKAMGASGCEIKIG